MQQLIHNSDVHPPITPRNVTIWLINFYRISRGYDLSLYWGLPYWIDNYEAILMWVDNLMKQTDRTAKTLGELRLMFEEILPI
ncbi:MAG TPA: hypothetical protein VK099_06420 [Alcanivoracaceae bacterium]|nr:hypothetical protein [Alcanivoracaceae bacterium]